MVEFSIRCLHHVEMSQKQGDAAQLKKEGKNKKAKSTITWHEIECDGSVKKSDSKVPVYNHSRLRRNGRTCYFGPQPKQVPQGLSRTTQLTCVTRKMIECNDL